MDISLVSVFSYVDKAAAPAAVAFGGWIVVTANKFLGLQNKSQAQDNLDQAIFHGEALMVDAWKSIENHNETIKVPDNTVTEIASKVIALAPGAEQLLNATPETVAPILQAKMTQWLHWQKGAVSGLLVGSDPEPSVDKAAAPDALTPVPAAP